MDQWQRQPDGSYRPKRSVRVSTRERLPDRRASWQQKVRIGGHTFHVSFGEYPDGRLGEVFIDAHKQGSFTRGALDSLARTVSLALQCGASPAHVAHSLRGMDFPPQGPVSGGSTHVTSATSVADWLAQEITAAYVATPPHAESAPEPPDALDDADDADGSLDEGDAGTAD